MRLLFRFSRFFFSFWLLLSLVSVVAAGPATVGPNVINSEGTLTAAAPRFSIPLEVRVQSRFAVQIAPQYAIDFGIIPAADFRRWQLGGRPRFLLRLPGVTDTRYVTLPAGSYRLVGRDLNGGVVNNNYAVKVRRFTGRMNDKGVSRWYVTGAKNSLPVPPNSWNGFAFRVPVQGKLWIDGVFSRGSDRRVRWEIVTEGEYQKFASGLPHKSLLSGSDPKLLGFHFPASPAPYYFLLINQGTTYSAFTVAREIYR